MDTSVPNKKSLWVSPWFHHLESIRYVEDPALSAFVSLEVLRSVVSFS